MIYRRNRVSLRKSRSIYSKESDIAAALAPPFRIGNAPQTYRAAKRMFYCYFRATKPDRFIAIVAC